MVFLKCFKKNTITILANDEDSQDKGTTLLLYAPLTDPKTLNLPERDHCMHLELWTQQVSCRITDFGKLKSVETECASGVLILGFSHHDRDNLSIAFELLDNRIDRGTVN